MATFNPPPISDASLAFVNGVFAEHRPMLIMDAVISSKRTISPSLADHVFVRRDPPSYKEGIVEDSYKVINTFQLGTELIYQIQSATDLEGGYISAHLFEQLFKALEP